jgi:CDP-diacylglycerol---glycerol-3-phosphate 3-phosphatidyltransferase
MERAVILIDILKKYFDRLPIRAENRRIINLPNAITVLRIGILPVLFLVLLEPGETLSLTIAILFILAALTDLLDGYVARRYNIVTRIGKLLDPIADKIIMSAAMVLLIPIGRIPAWVVALMIMRDFAVDGLRSMAAAEGHVIEASDLGKYKTFCQIIAVSALIIHYPIYGIDPSSIGTAFIYVALVLSMWSGFDYLVRFYKATIV